MRCMVLRCQNEPAAVVLVNPTDGQRSEAAVCAAHDRAFAAGEAWFFESDERVFYMGTDLAARALRHVTRVTARSSGDRLSNIDASLRIVKIHYTTIGTDDSEDFVELVMTPDLQSNFASLLSRGI